LKLRKFIALLIAFSVLAFNVASANNFIHRGLERSKAYLAHAQEVEGYASVHVNHSVDKGTASHDLNLTFNALAVPSESTDINFNIEKTRTFNSTESALSLEDLNYSSYKPPKTIHSI